MRGGEFHSPWLERCNENISGRSVLNCEIDLWNNCGIEAVECRLKKFVKILAVALRCDWTQTIARAAGRRFKAMRKIYIILASVGWAWLAIVAAYLGGRAAGPLPP